MELLIGPQTSMVQQLKFGNGKVDKWLLIHAGNKVNPF